MNIAVLYVTVAFFDESEKQARRFVETYQKFDPGEDHKLIVICNGGQPHQDHLSIFDPVEHETLIRKNQTGWDIGAYIECSFGPARDADVIVCLGPSCHFHRPGWLSRIAASWQEFGAGIYGSFTSNTVRTHINTTGFATAPGLICRYPFPVRERQDRYEFEHGENAFWRILKLSGYAAMLVTWDGVYPPEQWRQPENIMWRGDQSNCLMWCRHTDDYAGAKQEMRNKWIELADGPYR